MVNLCHDVVVQRADLYLVFADLQSNLLRSLSAPEARLLLSSMAFRVQIVLVVVFASFDCFNLWFIISEKQNFVL